GLGHALVGARLPSAGGFLCPGVDRVLLGLTAVAAGLLQVLRLALLASRRLVAGLVGLAAQLLGLAAGLRPGVGRLLLPVFVAGLDPCAVVGLGGLLLVGLLVELAGVGVEPAAGEVVVQRVAQRVVPVGDRGRGVTVRSEERRVGDEGR